MEAHSNNTKLKDRTLWYDGTSTVSESRLIRLMAERADATGLFVEEMTDAIRQYNQFVPKERQIRVKFAVDDYCLDWAIPAEFLSLNVAKYVEAKLIDEAERRSLAEHWPDEYIYARVNRMWDELKMYEQAGLTDVIRTLIYIINTLQKHKVVWGVGRGSSVASYVLYLIGVHDVDSVEYDLDITDFLRPE